MNKLTTTVTIPIGLGALGGLWLLFMGSVSWWLPFVFYFVFGVVINGTIAHRYFAHNSFQVPTSVRKIFAILVVIAAYGLPLMWVLQHRHHHQHSDQDHDDHTPRKGFWHAFFGWRSKLDTMTRYGTHSQIKRVLHDPVLVFTTQNYFAIIWSWLLLLALIDWQILLAGYCVGVMIDHIRLGLVNTVCHWPQLLGNYRNFDTKDHSQNNIVIGILGCGFGWHNNHHQNPRKLIVTNRWWEIDIEGYIGWIITKTFWSLNLTKR